LMVVDPAVAEQTKEPFNFLVADGATKSDAVYVGNGNEHGRLVRYDTKVIKTAGCTNNCFFLDPFDDAQTMVWVNDLVADFECHGSPCQEALYGRPKWCRQSNQYSSFLHDGQRKPPEKSRFFAVFPTIRASGPLVERGARKEP